MKKIYVKCDKKVGMLNEILKNNRENGDELTIVLDNGIYFLDQTLELYKKNTRNKRIIFEGSGNTIISGGVPVTDWKRMDGTSIWFASAPVKTLRRLYINGTCRKRARSKQTIEGEYNGLDKGTLRVEAKYLPKEALGAKDVEAVWEKAVWRSFRHRVKDIYKSDEIVNGMTYYLLEMEQPYYSWGTEMNGENDYNYLPSPHNPFVLENALCFLTEPGEWCYDSEKGYIYYWPYPEEDMERIEIIAPRVEQLVDIRGNSLSDKMSGIEFINIKFMHAAWNRPSYKGFACVQAQMLNASGEGHYKSVKEYVNGAIEISYAKDIHFAGCTFALMGGDAIRIVDGVSDLTISDCRFTDISSGAIQIGLPEHQMDKRQNSKLCSNIEIKNNYICNIGEEFPSSPAVTIYFAAKMHIVGNEIFNIPYTGISLGWGWANRVEEVVCCDNLIEYNCIHDFMKELTDGGAVYTLGKQKNCVIRYNYFYNIGNYHASVYTDNGSENMEIYGNVNEDIKRFDFSWEPSIKNISVHDNYSNSFCSLMCATNSRTYHNYYFPKGMICDEACEIIKKCGIGHHIEKKGVKPLVFDTYFYIEKEDRFVDLCVGNSTMQGLLIEFPDYQKVDKVLFDLFEYHQPRVITAYYVDDAGKFDKAGVAVCPENAGYIILKEHDAVTRLLFTVETEFNSGLMPIKNMIFL